MNNRINFLVDKTAELMPGVYTLEYESGKKGVEFHEEALAKFAEMMIEDAIQTLRNNGYDDAAKCLHDVHFGMDDSI